MQLVAQGDVTAFSGIYDEFAPQVYGLIAHVLSSRSTAEEVLGEVFVRLWNDSPMVSAEGVSIAAWLIVNARAAALEKLCEVPREASASKGKVTKVASSKARGKDGRGRKANRTLNPAWLPDPKAIGLIDARLGILHKAVNQLPPEQRKALDLAVFAGRSESEIAVAMGEPLGKVQRSLRAAVIFVKHRCRAVCGKWTANI